MKKTLCILAMVVADTIVVGQDPQVDRVLLKHQEMRPSERELAVYTLDWAASLEHAKRRALNEGRPICLIIIHAKYGDIASGHC